jgi:hypothetical protein
MKEYAVEIKVIIPVSASSDDVLEGRLNDLEAAAIEGITRKGWQWHGDIESETEYNEAD